MQRIASLLDFTIRGSGLFEPIKCNNRTLVDGALVNPGPVSVCRAHEEPLLVAVNLTTTFMAVRP